MRFDRRSRYEIQLGNPRFLKEISVANVQGIGSLPVSRLERRLGSLPAETLERIKQAVLFCVGAVKKEGSSSLLLAFRYVIDLPSTNVSRVVARNEADGTFD